MSDYYEIGIFHTKTAQNVRRERKHKMTLRQFWYRYIYLKSPAWKMTRFLRKRDKCRKCGSVLQLHLHHKNYRGYIWWNILLPDLFSDMETLCKRHHSMAHKSK